jgi:hypothetical protein
MSKNTMFYGLLIAGGLLAYYAWKKQSAKSDATANANLNSSTTGTFVDDVPVSQAIADSLDNTGGIKPVKTIKDKISQIVDRNVWTKRGGWQTVKGTDIHLPFCRHQWSSVLVKKK